MLMKRKRTKWILHPFEESGTIVAIKEKMTLRMKLHPRGRNLIHLELSSRISVSILRSNWRLISLSPKWCRTASSTMALSAGSSNQFCIHIRKLSTMVDSWMKEGMRLTKKSWWMRHCGQWCKRWTTLKNLDQVNKSYCWTHWLIASTTSSLIRNSLISRLIQHSEKSFCVRLHSLSQVWTPRISTCSKYQENYNSCRTTPSTNDSLSSSWCAIHSCTIA